MQMLGLWGTRLMSIKATNCLSQSLELDGTPRWWLSIQVTFHSCRIVRNQAQISESFWTRPNSPPWESTTRKQTHPKRSARSHAQLPNCCLSQHNLSFYKTKVEDPSLGGEFISDSLGISPLCQSLPI